MRPRFYGQAPTVIVHNTSERFSTQTCINDVPLACDIINSKVVWDPQLVYKTLEYYCTENELNAWFHEYIQESKGYIVIHSFVPYDKTGEELKHDYKTKVYKLYEFLLELLNQYTVDDNMLLTLKTWKRKIEKFLKDAQTIHHDNCDGYNL